MKYVFDDTELNRLKSESESVGFKRAETLLKSVLGGERDLFIAGETNRMTGFQERTHIYHPHHSHNVWRILIDCLDKEKAPNDNQTTTSRISS